MTKCSAVMTKNPVVCLPDDLVVKVAQAMKKQDVGPVPIVENGQTKKLVGMVTDRDIAVKVVGEERDIKTTKAQEIMSRKIVTCHAEDDVQMALDAMSENQLRRIPVVDDKGGIIGIISQADIATRVNQPEKTAAVLKDVSQASHGERAAEGGHVPNR